MACLRPAAWAEALCQHCTVMHQHCTAAAMYRCRYAEFKAAGAARYLLRIESSNPGERLQAGGQARERGGALVPPLLPCTALFM